MTLNPLPSWPATMSKSPAADEETPAQKFHKLLTSRPKATMHYSDGSRSDTGCFTVWFIIEQNLGHFTVRNETYCKLGAYTNIIDAKVSARRQGIEWIVAHDRPHFIYICVNNQSGVGALAKGHCGVQGCLKVSLNRIITFW